MAEKGTGDVELTSTVAMDTNPAAASSSSSRPAANNNENNNQRPSPQLEQLFLTMQYRKMQRVLEGPQKQQSKYHIFLFACTLVLIYGLTAATTDNGTQDGVLINLSLGTVITIGFWVLFAVILSAIVGGTKFAILLHWMVIYWPLIVVLIAILFQEDITRVYDIDDWGWIVLLVAEAVTLTVFVLVNYVYPKFVTSKGFREVYGARRFWRIRVEDDGTMEYDGMWGRCGRRYSCRYDGELKDGLPHGKGVWFDNNYNGEILRGEWENGEPVGPYSSRQYGGRGNLFSGRKIAFFMASDDSFNTNNMIPTNDDPPRCGIASVECSIAGDFYSHLPKAKLLIEATEGASENDVTIGSCCRQLDDDCDSPSWHAQLSSVNNVQIRSDDLRGIQIDGHLFAPTGLPFTKLIKDIVINVIKVPRKVDDTQYSSVPCADNTKTDKCDGDDDGETSSLQNRVYTDKDIEDTNPRQASASTMQLEVKNWCRINTKDALILIPGFNSTLQHSLETFGQMLAMTKQLLHHVYPICYQYPGAQIPTYRHASHIAASENNKKYFLQLLKGLQTEGIQRVHFITHSLGVQPLMNAFADTSSDGDLSPVAQCFERASDNADHNASVPELGKLVCSSITLLNPDFPVDAFRERGFQSIRRVTSIVTIVGNRTDNALLGGSVINGLCKFIGYEQPGALDSKALREQKGFHLPLTIGRNIESLHDTGKDDSTATFNQSLIKMRLSLSSSRIEKSEATESSRRRWLDCDVIDTTGLDTNVNKVHHGGFHLNSILLRDIEELVVTRKRASERTTLLHQGGNVFMYCHAPSFVGPD